MKRKLFVSMLMMVFVLLAFIPQAFAGRTKTYNLYLTSAISGSTTQASGVSTFVVEGEGVSRADNMSTVHIPLGSKVDLMVFQLYQVTLADAYSPYVSANSGSTITVSYKESIYDTTEHWAAAGVTNLLSPVAMSGVTRQQKTFEPTGIGSLRFYFTSGLTPFSAVTATVKLYFED